MQVLPAVDIRYLDDRWLDSNKRLTLMLADEFTSVPHDHLRIWCNRRARYQLPTLELISWLKEMIGDRSAIEVGAGNGDLGYHLGITATDSWIQQEPDLRFYYETLGQIPTKPTPDVVRMKAVEAVRHYNPQVVIAAWLTRQFIKGRDNTESQASFYGPVEEELLEHVETYIHIGNEAVHGTKTLLSRPHEKYWFPWLVSRATNPHQNCIYVWNK